MMVSLLVLGGAIALFRVTRLIDDEIYKIIGGLSGLTCILISVSLAPWLLKIAIIALLLTLPTCFQAPAKPPIHCPRLCVARGRCHIPKPRCLGWVRSPLRRENPHSEKNHTHQRLNLKEKTHDCDLD
ncbi:MAG: hypothetical protein ACFE0I_23815 [Elainellaceae cyanobacterium]